MADPTYSQSYKDTQTQNQQPEEIIRQDYDVRMSGGQSVIVPNAFREQELPLASMHKPDYSKAAEMAGGVSVIFQSGCI
jgi:hypothetical protein